ncbi:MAG: GIY-YIG nuclease family protein [Gammaproteobacteria bacterium]|nr:GIY-YIG nuclease family protein [Gammaproteobacteria bacterium]
MTAPEPASDIAVRGWYVYVVECADGSLYTGVARDAAARLAQHNAGRGARYTRSRLPVRLVRVEPVADRAAALRREYAIKQLPVAAKRALIDRPDR